MLRLSICRVKAVVCGDDGHVQALPVIPYLVERLFSIFLRIHPQFKVRAWQYSMDQLKEHAGDAARLIPVAHGLKYLYNETRDRAYLDMYSTIQGKMIEAIQKTTDKYEGFRIR